MGSSTAVVSLLTTSIEWRLISMLTRTEKNSVMFLESMRRRRTSIAIRGLFSTRYGSFSEERPATDQHPSYYNANKEKLTNAVSSELEGFRRPK